MVGILKRTQAHEADWGLLVCLKGKQRFHPTWLMLVVRQGGRGAFSYRNVWPGG